MPLESTMICLDNSEWMRNGDYAPSRIESQQDAASLICNDRTQSNPESTVGVLSMASQNEGVDLMVSPTEDAGKVLASFAKVELGGRINFATALRVAELALKHRKNKNGAVRIIAFVGSPLVEDAQTLKKLASRLRKNNIAVDIISMGEIDENSTKLQEFITAINTQENSHLISVPPGVSPLDALSTSPVLHRSTAHGSGVVGGGGAAANFDDFGGIDPNMDPELAMAIRASTEEARAQEEARAREAIDESRANGEPAGAGAAGFGGPGASDEDDEDALMQQALQLSMMDFGPPSASTSSSSSDAMAVEGNASFISEAAAAVGDSATAAEDDDEEAMRLALELSLGASSSSSRDASAGAAAVAGGAATEHQSTSETDAMAFLDPEFVNQLLGSVDVDMNDPLIQSALAQMGAAKPSGDGAVGGGASGGGAGEDDKDSKKRKGDDV